MSPGEPSRLAKFFTLTSFVVILVFTIVLSLILSHRAQKIHHSEEYLKLLAANLNHQVFQQFLVPTGHQKAGRITQLPFTGPHERLDSVVKNTIHGFHVEELAIYDQGGVCPTATAGAWTPTAFESGRHERPCSGSKHFERLGNSFVDLP